MEIITNMFGRKINPLSLMALERVTISNLKDFLMVEGKYWYYDSNVKVDFLCLPARIKPMQA